MTFLKNGNSSEKVNLKFCKYMLRVSKKCTNIAVLTELGRFPIVPYMDILKQMLMYWHRLEHSPSKLLNRAFSEYKNIATLGIPIYSFIVKK